MQKNNIYRWLLLLLFFSASTILIRAANVEYLTLTVKDGTVVIVLAEHPVITYTDNTLHIQSSTTTIDVPISDITKTEFSGIIPTSITGLIASKPQLRNGVICFEQLPLGSSVTIHSLNGTLLSSVNADDKGQAAVGTYQLPTGVYIVRSAIQTFKIIIK